MKDQAQNRSRPRQIIRLTVQNRLRRNLIITGSILMINAAVVFSYFYFGRTTNAYSSGMTGSTGSWNAASTWSSARVPSNNDTLTVPPGSMVTVTVNTSTYLNMKIIVYGTLHINGGKKLDLCNGMIDIMAGGKIYGDNGGSMVDICTMSVWNGTMAGDGPMQIGATVLPVVLSSFDAESTKDGTVNISWQTASEVNCDYFTVERSSNGTDFENLTQVKGAGNSTIAHQYSFVDDNPHGPVSYYRLRQVDFDGKFAIFKTIPVNINAVNEMSVYPNPINTGESVTVHIPAADEKTLQVTVIDVQGKKIFSQIVEKENSTDNMIRFVTDKFPAAGTYFVTASGQVNKYLKKIVVL